MSQHGQLVFFSTKKNGDPAGLLRQLFDWMGATSFCYATRSLGADMAWQRFQNDAFSQEDEEEFVGRNYELYDLVNFYREPSSLTVALQLCPISRRLAQAVANGIPRDIRGDFLPTDPHVTIGSHDVFEAAEHEEGFLFGRAFLSVDFFGYNTPFDWECFRERVFALPEVQRIRSELEAIVGPLECCVFWDI